MGGLGDRINPEDEALAIAAGNRVYVWAYGKAECIATMPKKVLSLEVWNDRLVCSGAFQGVMDTLENKVVAGTFHSWSNLAVFANKLYGTVKTDLPTEQCGIWDINRMEKKMERIGPTRVLASCDGMMMDCGEYYEVGEVDYDPLPAIVMDTSLYETFSQTSLVKAFPLDQIQAVLPNGKSSLLLATSADVVAYDMGTKKYSSVYKIGSMYHVLWEKISDIMANFAGPNRKQAWGDFKYYFEASMRAMPRSFRYVKNQFTGGKSVRIEPLPFEEACEKYKKSFPLFTGFMGGMMVVGDGHHLFPIIAHTFGALLGYHLDKSRIHAMARINGNVVIGGKTKRVEIADPALRHEDKNIIHKFSSPVYDMIVIPIEVYDEGIKQRVLQRKGQRAAHARGSKAVVITRAA